MKFPLRKRHIRGFAPLKACPCAKTPVDGGMESIPWTGLKRNCRGRLERSKKLFERWNHRRVRVSGLRVNTLDESSSVPRILRTNYTIGPNKYSLNPTASREFPQDHAHRRSGCKPLTIFKPMFFSVIAS